MINQNRTKKYLLYAIGEIVLVVIGILIALQINNQNDERKAEDAIKKFYKATILDLNEASNATTAQLDWFKNYQDLNFSIYKQAKGEIPKDRLKNYNPLIWSHSFRPLITENYKSKFEQINNEKIQELFRDILWREQLTVEAVNEWNDMKFQTLRPYFFKNHIYNAETSFNQPPYEFITSSSVDLLKVDKLIEQYDTSEFEQILFELRHKTSWVIISLESLEEANKNLKSALGFYLEDDLESLKAIEPLKYYMND
ncbi:hypothetical protein [Winogradskyella sp. MIT101101]|uniref:hypothetical protein n=1 Tax=Winogradskyella sp. MIT101101 TaxID=3098297 RepID=UPI00399975D9